MEVLPVIALAMTAVSTIQSADAQGQANKIAGEQVDQEQNLLNQAQTQQAQEGAAEKNSMTQAAQLAARRAMAGNSQGYQSTVLTGPQGPQQQNNPGLMVPGKTLLG